MRPNLNTELKAGTAGGSLLAIISNLGDDLLRTALMSGVGVVVSFFVSLALKYIVTWLQRLWRRRVNK